MDRQERPENVSKWGSLDKDMLANIFKKLDVVDVIMGASRVCITWFLAAHNKTIWNTIKLNDLDSIVLDNGEEHRYHLRDILIEINKFSRAATVEFFFNANNNVLEEDLVIISNGLPNIRKLALRIQKTQNLNSFASSFSKWKNLQTLIIDKFTKNDDLNPEFKAIAENCRNLTTLKITYTLDQELASIIVGKLPNLKSLSFRCTFVSVEAVKSLVIGLHNLKSLNLSHCVFFKQLDNSMMFLTVGMTPDDKSVILSIEKLQSYKLCCSECTICRDVLTDSTLCYKRWETDEMKEFEF